MSKFFLCLFLREYAPFPLTGNSIRDPVFQSTRTRIFFLLFFISFKLSKHETENKDFF